MNFLISKLLIRAVLTTFGLLFISLHANAQTGDAQLDTWLSVYSTAAGNNTQPTNLTPANYPNGVTKCKLSTAPSWETLCPSDLLYTPNANTGGYQAFGVGADYRPSGTYYYATCYVQWIYNAFLDAYEPLIFCNYQSVNIAAHTYGSAMARIKFGSNTTSTPFGAKPISTLAFKANITYLPNAPGITCTPTLNLVGAAPCATLQFDRYAIPGNGYEDKVLITDLGCTKLLRDGDDSDALANCYTHDGMNWQSDLPGVYRDTTASDTATNYVPGVGSVVPWAIIENQTYYWWTDFYQWGQDPAGPISLRHNSAITTSIDLPGGPPCGTSPETCAFNVDQTTIAPVINL